jgi:reductive dehalogenase
MIKILLLLSGFLIFTFFLAFGWVSYYEHEPKAAKRSFLVAVLASVPFFMLVFFPYPFVRWVGMVLLLLLGIFIMILLLPIQRESAKTDEGSLKPYDERNTMFSRFELCHRPTESELFYASNPGLLDVDKIWQKKPGLMATNSKYYNAFTFSAAESSFFTIEMLRPFVHEKPNIEQVSVKPEALSRFVLNWVKQLGAVSTGICETKSAHFYSVRGRGEAYGKPVNNKHKYAIAFTVEMNKEMLATGPEGPTLMESAKQYLQSGTIAIQVARFLQNLGYDARAHVDGNYEVICPLVARDSGLGEIGRMGLLLTPELGPRVRIAVVTTNAPMLVSKVKRDGSVEQFCKLCKKCADVCPAQAIPKGEKTKIDGVNRWQINQEKCFTYWSITGTDCGRCMSVCPYAHPNNLMHNMVRWGIKNSFIFQKLALYMDDFFYGRKPKIRKGPSWLYA